MFLSDTHDFQRGMRYEILASPSSILAHAVTGLSGARGKRFECRRHGGSKVLLERVLTRTPVQEETPSQKRNWEKPGETGRNWEKPDETGRNREKPDETGRNWEKPGETGRNWEKPGETGRNWEKPDETGRNP